MYYMLNHKYIFSNLQISYYTNFISSRLLLLHVYLVRHTCGDETFKTVGFQKQYKYKGEVSINSSLFARAYLILGV